LECKDILFIHVFGDCHLIISTCITHKHGTTYTSDIASPRNRHCIE